MTEFISNETVLITGATSGLGEAIGKLLLAKGFTVIGVGRQKSALAIQSQKKLGRFFGVECDLSDSLATSQIVSRAEAISRQKISHFIHCAGFAVSGETGAIPLSAIQSCLEVNYLSAVSITQQLLPRFKSDGGTFSFIGSGVAVRAIPFYGPYCSAKSALLSFSDSLRVELKNFPIHILYFSPGPVRTAFQKSTLYFGKQFRELPFKGKEPSDIAKKFLKSFLQKRKRVFLGRNARLASHLNHLWPSAADWVIGLTMKEN